MRVVSPYGFGANAAWWAIMILAVNFQSMLKRLVLGGGYVAKRMKAIRHALIHPAVLRDIIRVSAVFV